MKKLVMNLVACLAMSGAATAQTFSVADVEVLQGKTGAFTLTVDVGEGTYTGFQFQIQFPATGFTTLGTTVTQAWDGAAFSVGDLESGVANGSAMSISDTAIPNGSLEVGTVKFSVGEEVELGEYDVTISSFDFLDGTNYTRAVDVTFKVKVVSTLVLDENSTTMPITVDGVNVKVMRTLIANEWGTICLPFAMTENQVKTAFGDDVRLGDFKGYQLNAEEERITVLFEDATAIEANHPYIIWVTAPKTEFTVDNVDVAPSDDPRVSFGTGTGNKRKLKDFVGTFVADFNFYEAAWNVPLFLSDNSFWYASEETQTMKAFRAFFDFNDDVSGVDSSRIKMAFGDDTGISDSSIRNDDGREEEVYDLQGRRVKTPGKGLYISQGKIVNKK